MKWLESADCRIGLNSAPSSEGTPMHTKLHRIWPLALGVIALSGCNGGVATPSASPAVRETPDAATLSNPKIASALANLARRVESAADATKAAALSSATARVNGRREIEVYVHVASVGPRVASSLCRTGAQIGAVSQALRIYQGWATPTALKRLAALPVVERISLPAYARTDRAQPPR